MTTLADEPGPMRLGTILAELLATMGPDRRRQLVALMLLMLLGAVAELVSIGSVVPFLAILADGNAAQAPGWVRSMLVELAGLTGTSPLQAAALLFMVAAVAAAALRLALGWSSQSCTLGFGHELAVEIQRRILHQPYAFHIGQHSSRILASLEKVQILSSGVLLQVMQAVSALVIGGFIIIAVASVDLSAAAISIVAFGVCYWLVSRVSGPRLAHNSDILGSAYDRRLKLVQESLGAIRDVILDRSQPVHLEEFRAIDWQFSQARLSSGFLVTAPRFVIEAAGMLLIATLALVVASEGGLAMALPVLGALSLGALRLLPLLQQLYQAWVSLAANRSIATEVLSLLALPLPDEGSSGTPVPFNRTIRFDQVSFTYPGRNSPALDDISFSIPHGSRVAIVGKTGSGKSTLVDLLMGLLTPSTGRIAVDDVALDNRTLGAWQQRIAHVPQSIFLADASVARNVALGGPPSAIDENRVAQAVKLAQLDDVVAGLPRGLETPVGEGGISLSGGQRQRLGLARAIYKDAAVLILDEATNALDREIEEAILEVLARLHSRGVTVVMVSHRPSAVRECDLLIRLDRGKVVAIEPAEDHDRH